MKKITIYKWMDFEGIPFNGHIIFESKITSLIDS